MFFFVVHTLLIKLSQLSSFEVQISRLPTFRGEGVSAATQNTLSTDAPQGRAVVISRTLCVYQVVVAQQCFDGRFRVPCVHRHSVYKQACFAQCRHCACAKTKLGRSEPFAHVQYRQQRHREAPHCYDRLLKAFQAGTLRAFTF